MNITLLSIVASLVSVFYLARSLYKFFRKEKGQTFFKLFLTTIVWGGVILFSIFPNLAHFLSVKFGLGENLNTLIFIGFIIIFAVLFKLIKIIEKIEKDISEIVRKEALKKLEKK